MDKGSVVRTTLLGLALVNQILTVSGKSPLPFDDQSVDLAISTGFTLATSLWAWWKNNYLSKKGLDQKSVLKRNDLYKP